MCAKPASPLGEKHIFENQSVKLGLYHIQHVEPTFRLFHFRKRILSNRIRHAAVSRVKNWGYSRGAAPKQEIKRNKITARTKSLRPLAGSVPNGQMLEKAENQVFRGVCPQRPMPLPSPNTKNAKGVSFFREARKAGVFVTREISAPCGWSRPMGKRPSRAKRVPSGFSCRGHLTQTEGRDDA